MAYGEPITQWILGTDQLQQSLEVCLQDGLLGLLRSDSAIRGTHPRDFSDFPASFLMASWMDGIDFFGGKNKHETSWDELDGFTMM